MRPDSTDAEATLERATVTKHAQSLYLASPAERIRLIREQVPASRLKDLSDEMHISQEHLLDMLNLPRASVQRKSRQGATLTTEQGERVIGLECLIGQVAIMVEESGNRIRFDAACWVGWWLDQPIPALGGARPSEFVGILTGQKLLSEVLLQSQAGVFA